MRNGATDLPCDMQIHSTHTAANVTWRSVNDSTTRLPALLSSTRKNPNMGTFLAETRALKPSRVVRIHV